MQAGLAGLQELISQACAAPANRFGPAFLAEHILVHRDYGLRLATALGADAAVVEAAALLHDLAAVRDFGCLSEHAQQGAQQAARILQDMGVAPDVIDRICRCITMHSAPVAVDAESLEVVCVSNADAMAQLARPGYWFYYIFSVRQMNYAQGMDWYRARLAAHKAALIPQAQAMIANEIARLEAILEPTQS